MLAMANLAEPHTNNSQFYICLSPRQYLDHKHVVFGKMVKGGEPVLNKLLMYGSHPNGFVWKTVKIIDCGEVGGTKKKVVDNRLEFFTGYFCPYA